MRFSEYFDIQRTDKDDWFDVDLATDSPHFLDPYKVLQDDSPEWAEVRSHLNGFFEAFYSALSSSETTAGKSKTSDILLMLEPQEFRLGMGRRVGSGVGMGVAPFSGVKLGVPQMEGPWDSKETRSFLRRLGSFDRVSDLACVATKRPLTLYTQSVARRHGIPMTEVQIANLSWDTNSKRWQKARLQLPVDAGGHPVILVPEKFLSGRSAEASSNFRESEFVEFLTLILEKSRIGRVTPEVRLSRDAVTDIAVSTNTTLHIIECKKRVPQTSSRLEEFVAQIKRYATIASSGQYRGLNQKLVLAAPGRLAETHHRYLATHGISVWDGPWIYQRASLVGLQEEAIRFVGYFEPHNDTDAFTFEERLSSVSPGRANWSIYQRLCQEIFEYLFCPPLRTPIRESRTENGINRRDFILPNYTTEGHWDFLRREYRADYIVVDPKNYAGKIGKERILQVANYLQRHGTGLFAILVSRVGADRAALLTIREQWILHDKMIIVLQDADLLQMLADKAFGNSPVELIRQKIEDFRIGI
ncbi:hypothetical protein ABT010_15095 [Streptomyces sp. NPDC002668]|uniref:hypothetical protein n=1 Tax=Streptomyces sp. NPDC002668 TaxID=3154422 RepID=UPI00331D89ED